MRENRVRTVGPDPELLYKLLMGVKCMHSFATCPFYLAIYFRNWFTLVE